MTDKSKIDLSGTHIIFNKNEDCIQLSNLSSSDGTLEIDRNFNVTFECINAVFQYLLLHSNYDHTIIDTNGHKYNIDIQEVNNEVD